LKEINCLQVQLLVIGDKHVFEKVTKIKTDTNSNCWQLELRKNLPPGRIFLFFKNSS